MAPAWWTHGATVGGASGGGGLLIEDSIPADCGRVVSSAYRGGGNSQRPSHGIPLQHCDVFVQSWP